MKVKTEGEAGAAPPVGPPAQERAAGAGVGLASRESPAGLGIRAGSDRNRCGVASLAGGDPKPPKRETRTPRSLRSGQGLREGLLLLRRSSEELDTPRTGGGPRVDQTWRRAFESGPQTPRRARPQSHRPGGHIPVSPGGPLRARVPVRRF